MMQKKLSLVICVLFLLSCDQKSDREKEIEKVDADFELIRFDRKFAQADEASLPELKKEFPFLFPEQYPDSVWVNKLHDSIQEELDTQVHNIFPQFSEETDALHSLFQHVEYYFPKFQVPNVITITSDVDYKNKALYTGKYLFIALDTYLGEDHKFYIGIQEYLKKNFRKEQIIPDAAGEIAENYVPEPESRTFLAHMLYYGKILYLKDLFIPEVSDAEKIGYTQKELDWAKANEDQIWRYFIENEVLYDTDSNLYSRFLYPGPFSKFYLQLDSESPDRIGQYIGWHIIRSYMEKNDTSVQKMLNMPAAEIFDKANYKPQK